VSVFDSLGNVHALQTFYVKTAPGAWSVFASTDGAPVGAAPVGRINFKTDGSIDTATTTLPFAVPVAVTTGAATPFNVNLDYTGTTQFGSNFGVNAQTQDGFASGRLAGFNIGADGNIVGSYTNGQSSVLGQVVMANFANPNGLQPLGNNLWSESATSGAPLVGSPNTGGLGLLQSSAVEESNVDLTAELVNMITAQRVYQANAQTIKTQDQVLQTLVNLR
jgi:flagellar hook protein FlgE